MVDSEYNSFGILHLINNEINVKGFGRETSRILNFSEKN
jgi:hypothetical protein